jgi:hypothetical protein
MAGRQNVVGPGGQFNEDGPPRVWPDRVAGGMIAVFAREVPPMPMRSIPLLGCLCLAALARPAAADEVWSCRYTVPSSPETIPVTYRLVGQQLRATWVTGTEEDFRIVVNNRFGLIAVSPTAEIEPENRQPTVAATVLVLNRGTHEFRASSVSVGSVPGREPLPRAPMQGRCSEQ